MGRRGKREDEEDLNDGEDNTEEIRIERGKKKRKPWQDKGRRKGEQQSELDPLWEVRPKR